MQIEQEAHRLEMQRKREQEERQEEKRRKMGLPQKGDCTLSREEQEARIWAFMYASFMRSPRVKCSRTT
jgi:hypothetical protein